MRANKWALKTRFKWSYLQTIRLKIIYIYKVHTISFQTFFVWALLLIVHTLNFSLLRTSLLRLQCTCCTVPTTSGRPHGSPLVWACQWPSSQPLSSPQLSHKQQPLSNVCTKGRLRNYLGQIVCGYLGQIVCDKDGVVDWCIVLLEMPLTRFQECWPFPTESLPELP